MIKAFLISSTFDFVSLAHLKMILVFESQQSLRVLHCDKTSLLAFIYHLMPKYCWRKMIK